MRLSTHASVFAQRPPSDDAAKAIHAGLEFPAASCRAVLQALFALPAHLAPTRVLENEGDRGDPIGDTSRFIDAVEDRGFGPYLRGPAGTFDIRVVEALPVQVSCFLRMKTRDAKAFMAAMASAQRLFGFACAFEELERRNRVMVRIGVDSIESWVGCDTQRYIPGLYWLTLLPRALADRHGMPLQALAAAALEHVALDGDQHLFRFYDKPADWWRMDDLASHIPGARPGVFDIGPVQAKASTATSLAAVDDVLDAWP